MTFRLRVRQLIAPLTTALILCATAARAEVQKFLVQCGGHELCPSYQLVVTPPDGWVLDNQASSENKVQIMVPKGESFATAEPLIYAQIFFHDKRQSLADFARASNARWLAANPKAKITEMPAVERLNGKPAFLRFAFDNPGKAQQAYEVGAFGLDSDKEDGNEFVLDVVMSGNSKAALDRADAAYTAFLKAH
jgi:hypothetical protein